MGGWSERGHGASFEDRGGREPRTVHLSRLSMAIALPTPWFSPSETPLTSNPQTYKILNSLGFKPLRGDFLWQHQKLHVPCFSQSLSSITFLRSDFSVIFLWGNKTKETFPDFYFSKLTQILFPTPPPLYLSLSLREMWVPKGRMCLVQGHRMAGQLAQGLLNYSTGECSVISYSGPGPHLWALPADVAQNVWFKKSFCHSAIQAGWIRHCTQQRQWRGECNPVPQLGNPEFHYREICRVWKDTEQGYRAQSGSWQRLPGGSDT